METQKLVTVEGASVILNMPLYETKSHIVHHKIGMQSPGLYREEDFHALRALLLEGNMNAKEKDMSTAKLVTVDEACKILKRTDEMVLRYAQSKRFKVIEGGPVKRRWMFDRAEVEAFALKLHGEVKKGKPPQERPAPTAVTESPKNMHFSTTGRTTNIERELNIEEILRTFISYEDAQKLMRVPFAEVDQLCKKNVLKFIILQLGDTKHLLIERTSVTLAAIPKSVELSDQARMLLAQFMAKSRSGDVTLTPLDIITSALKRLMM